MNATDDLIEMRDGVAMVSSLQIAERFGREHKTVLAAIQSLECSAEFNRQNFLPISYSDKMNRKQPMYWLTRDGFSMLVMGFTGREAMQWKEKFIAAFNTLERKVIALAKPSSAGLPATVSDRAKSAMTALVEALQAEEREKADAELSGMIDTLHEDRNARDRAAAEAVIRLDQLTRAIGAVRGSLARNEPLLTNYRPDWEGRYVSKIALDVDDVLIGLGFKTKQSGDAFLSSLRIVTHQEDRTGGPVRDFGSHQPEFPTIAVVNDAMLRSGFIESVGNDGPFRITPKGRGMMYARLAAVGAHYDLRPWSEAHVIRGMLLGGLQAGELPELRAAYLANRNPASKRFSFIAASQVRAAE